MDPCALLLQEYKMCNAISFIEKFRLCYNEEYRYRHCLSKAKKVHESSAPPFSKPPPENTPVRPEQTSR
jgi:hypothetical protein